MLFVRKPVVLAYYLYLVIIPPAPNYIFRIAASDFCVSAFVSFLLLALVGGLVGFRSDFICIGDTVAPKYFFVYLGPV